MKKQRYSVNDIAEVLIEEIENFKKSASSIHTASERLQQTKVEISPQSFDLLTKILGAEQKNQEAFLSHLNSIIGKNSVRVPNWLITLIIVFFITFAVVSLYTYKKLEYVKVLESNVEYYQSELNKLTE